MEMTKLGSCPHPPLSPTCPPLLHLLLHVDALLLQQLSLGEGPVHGLSRCLSTRRPLPLLPGLLGVVEAKHVALPHDDPVSCGGDRELEFSGRDGRSAWNRGQKRPLGTHLSAGRWALSPFCHSRRCQRLHKAPGSQSLRDKQQMEGQPGPPGISPP